MTSQAVGTKAQVVITQGKVGMLVVEGDRVAEVHCQAGVVMKVETHSVQLMMQQAEKRRRPLHQCGES